MAGPYLIDVGNNFASATSVALNPSSAIPAGVCIVILGFDGSTGGSVGSVTDTKSNSYIAVTNIAANNVNANGQNTAFICYNCNALSTGDTITYTDAASSFMFFDASYAILNFGTGNPLDAAVTATAFGNSAAPSVASRTPGVAGEMLIAFASNAPANPQFANWLSPFVSWAGGASAMLNYSSVAQTFTPLGASSGTWGAFVFGLKLGVKDPNLTGLQIAYSASTTCALTVPSTIPAGSLIIMDGWTSAPNGSTCSIADTQGNVYKKITSVPMNGNPFAGGSNGNEIWFYCYNCNELTAADTVTVTDLAASGSSTLAWVLQYSTYITGSQDPLDPNVTQIAYGNGTSQTINAGVPTQTNELLYGSIGNPDNQFYASAATGWTQFSLWSNISYKINSTLAPPSFALTDPFLQPWGGTVFGFRSSPYSYSRPSGEVVRSGALGINAWPNRRAKDVNRGGKLLRKVLQFGNAASVDIQTPVEGNWWFNPPLTVSAVAKSMAIIGSRLAASMTAKFSGVSRSVSESRNSAAMTAKFTGASRSMVESKSSAALSAKFSAASSALISARAASSMLAKFSATAKALVGSRGASSSLAKFSAAAKALVGSSVASSALAKFAASTKAMANSRGVLSGSIVFSATGATKALTAARGSASMLASFAGQSSARVKSFGSNSATVSFVARSASKAMARASNTATATFSAISVSKAVLAARAAPSMLASFAGRSSARVRSLGSNSALTSLAARSASMVMSRASNTASAVFSATGVARALTSARGSASLLASFAARSASRSAARASNTATATFSATGVTRALTAARAAASMTASFSATARAIATGRGSNSGTAMFSATGATKALVSARAAASMLASFTGRSAAKALSSAAQSLKTSASGRSSASTRSRVGQLLTASFSGHSIATLKARSSTPHSTVSMAARSFAAFLARGANVAFAQVVATASMSLARLTAFGQATPISSDIPIGRLLGPTVPRTRTLGQIAPRVRTLSAPPGA